MCFGIIGHHQVYELCWRCVLIYCSVVTPRAIFTFVLSCCHAYVWFVVLLVGWLVGFSLIWCVAVLSVFCWSGSTLFGGRPSRLLMVSYTSCRQTYGRKSCLGVFEFYLSGVRPVALCTRIFFRHIPAIATENLLMLFFSLFTTCFGPFGPSSSETQFITYISRE
jgi:hypothetical protein